MSSLSDQIRNAVYNIENPGGQRTYMLSYAAVGTSGYSFGNTQGDIANNDNAAATFKDILTHTKSISGLTQSQIDAIIVAAKTPNEGDVANNPVVLHMTAINKALSSDYGKTQIDALDAHRIGEVQTSVQSMLDAASKNPGGAGVLGAGANRDPVAIAELSQYVNQFGLGVDKFKKYLAGEPVTMNGYSLHLTSAPTLKDIETYIGDTLTFSTNPRPYANFIDHAHASGAQVKAHEGAHAHPTPSGKPHAEAPVGAEAAVAQFEAGQAKFREGYAAWKSRQAEKAVAENSAGAALGATAAGGVTQRASSGIYRVSGN